ncbi:hypothetical protein HNY73_002741 [Argiope bruennichi]|uniref:Uncharacterized protein n=1 Tax=Argiope bruennichi TaxID=94029 RepID=A0A8T0FUP2_ARGBR|nr:hypothetical protein HNY73_002741 [Argiope bruennichi]
MQFLSEGVEGALTTLNIRGELSVHYDFKPSTANLYVNSKNNPNPEIFATLLRFRLPKFAITSDELQEFLQLILDEEDINCITFLLFKTEKDANGKIQVRNEILTYRFSLLPFELTSSPFMFFATLLELANMHSDTYPTAVKHLENNFSMDDIIMEVDIAEQATTLYQEMQDLMAQISLPLAKWSTNSKNLQAIWELKDINFKNSAPFDWIQEELNVHQFSRQPSK